MEAYQRYIGGAIGHKGLPSCRITIPSLRALISKYISRCKPARNTSIRYPRSNVASTLLNTLWENLEAGRHEHADVPDSLGEDEEPEAIHSEDDDFGYSWQFAEDKDDSDDAGDSARDDVDDEAEDEVELDDMDQGVWEDEYDADGYAAP